MSRIVNISEAKAQLSRLVDEVQRGGRVVIGNAGRPVAVLSAGEREPAPRPRGGWKDADVWIAEDFDDDLPANVQALRPRAAAGGKSGDDWTEF
mgnify:CR=1 FL=1